MAYVFQRYVVSEGRNIRFGISADDRPHLQKDIYQKRGMVEMGISKETFCKVIQLIKEQDRINDEFGKALDLVGNGHFVFGTENRYYEALLLVLKEALPDKYDYISWWLYEATPDYRVWAEDGKKEWNLKEPAALYDFIINECQ